MPSAKRISIIIIPHANPQKKLQICQNNNPYFAVKVKKRTFRPFNSFGGDEGIRILHFTRQKCVYMLYALFNASVIATNNSLDCLFYASFESPSLFIGRIKKTKHKPFRSVFRFLVEMRGFEPLTHALRTHCSTN